MRLSLAASDSSTVLRPVLAVLRVRKWIIVLVTTFVAAVSIGASLSSKPLYEASSQVLISRTNLGNVLTGTQDPSALEFDFNRIVQTQANLARTPRVARRTLDASGLHGADEDTFLDQSSVQTDPNTDILKLRVQDGDRGRAVLLARRYAGQFVAYKQAQTVNRLLSLQRDLTDELARLDPDSALAQQDRGQLRRIRNLISLGDSSISVVASARKAAQIAPNAVSSAVLGIVAGLVLGIGLAFLVDLLDTRLRRSRDVEDVLGLPLLGRLTAPSKALRRSDRLATLAEPDSANAESFRVLRTNLAFADLDGRARTIIVSSAVQSEGKSTTVANLGVALAQAGRHVILVDFDFRRPYLDRFFGLSGSEGVTDVVRGETSLDDALASIALKPVAADGPAVGGPGAVALAPGRLEVLATGKPPPNVGEFITSDALPRLLTTLRARCDVLLIDSPPLLQVGDTMALTAHVDAILVVARLRVVRRPMVDEVKRLLATSPATALGVVITDAEYDDTGAGYGYYYTPSDTNANGKSPHKAPPPRAPVG